MRSGHCNMYGVTKLMGNQNELFKALLMGKRSVQRVYSLNSNLDTALMCDTIPISTLLTILDSCNAVLEAVSQLRTALMHEIEDRKNKHEDNND